MAKDMPPACWTLPEVKSPAPGAGHMSYSTQDWTEASVDTPAGSPPAHTASTQASSSLTSDAIAREALLRARLQECRAAGSPEAIKPIPGEGGQDHANPALVVPRGPAVFEMATPRKEDVTEVNRVVRELAREEFLTILSKLSRLASPLLSSL